MVSAISRRGCGSKAHINQVYGWNLDGEPVVANQPKFIAKNIREYVNLCNPCSL